LGSARYAELHAHSAFSFLDGASSPEEMVAEAACLGLSALALTDHNGLYGVVRHSQAAAAVGLPTVFGAEFALPVTAGGGQPVFDSPTGVPDPRAEHLLVLARGPQGYRQLATALATGHLAGGEKGRPKFELAQLGEQADGQWLVLTGCRKGAVRRALAGSGPDAARRELDRLVSLFGQDNVAVEINATGAPSDAGLHDALAELAAAARLPLVATTGAHFANPKDADLAAAMAAVRANLSLDELDGWLPPPTAHLRSAAELLQLHQRHPQAVLTAAELGTECAFDLHLIAPNLPPYPVPPGHTEASWLRHLVAQGGAQRYGPRSAERVPGAWAQIDHEMQVIEQLGFPGYFLVVYDLVQFCREQGILCQGRGSAANSAVCYALGITAVDAVKHGLLFERFLAPERDGPPDIDLDIESIRREEVIQHVYAKFGRRHAAQVANVISYRPRSAVRDAAKALGYDVGQQDAWSKSIDRWGSLRSEPKSVPVVSTRTLEKEARAAEQWGVVDSTYSAALPSRRSTANARSRSDRDSDAVTANIPEAVLDLGERLLRMPRHLGIHSGGMVMCDRPVIEVCPVEWARMAGRTVLQWDKEDCADAGLVKFDLLGLGMLTAIRYAFEHIEARTGQRLELHHLPDDDPAVYELLCAADTVGTFQVESRAQMATLPRLKPQNFYDIVVEVALIRPGPIQGKSVHPYLARRNGQEEVTYPHPLLEKSLKRTLGVPLFQEQLMQMAIDIADFTPAEADQLRRAMGSKRSAEKMAALRDRLLAGMTKNGVRPEVQEQIYDKLKAFADFGFPESHSYSFAFLVYASCWLKVHYPAAFYAGVLAAQPMGFYSPQSLCADARRHGVTVLGPCLNNSAPLAGVEQLAEAAPLAPVSRPLPLCPPQAAGAFGPDPDLRTAVRLGLAQVRGIGLDKAQVIVAERDAHGPFADLRDLVRRVQLSTAQLEALATAGAAECFGLSRREALWAAGALSQEGPDTLPGVSVGVAAPTLPGQSEVEVLAADAWATGVTARSPVEFVRSNLARNGVITVAEVFDTQAGKRVAVGGVVTHRQRPGTAHGVTFLSLEDETGFLNVVCSAGLWQRHYTVARRAPAVLVRGKIERADGSTNLIAEYLAPLRLPVATKSRDFR